MFPTLSGGLKHSYPHIQSFPLSLSLSRQQYHNYSPRQQLIQLFFSTLRKPTFRSDPKLIFPFINCNICFMSVSSSSEKRIADIENEPRWKKVHDEAVKNQQQTYIDPETGYTVFTELSHLKRGYCCGSKCRHCPYNHENVGKPKEKWKKP